MNPSGTSAPASPLRVCRTSTSSVCPASRSSSFSPTHMMGRRPAASAAFTLRATISSVSPNWCAALGVADDGVLRELGDHLGADLAGGGDVVLPVDVLRA